MAGIITTWTTYYPTIITSNIRYVLRTVVVVVLVVVDHRLRFVPVVRRDLVEALETITESVRLRIVTVSIRRVRTAPGTTRVVDCSRLLI